MNRIGLIVALAFCGCREEHTATTQPESTAVSETIPGKTITFDQLEAMFTNIQEQTQWDMSGPMLWGYFFTDDERAPLEPVRDELVGKGYRFVDLYQSDEDDQDGPRIWWLHVEREESHTPRALDARNDELYLVAERYGIRSYDGMDVGPVAQRANKSE